jgi:subtilase family serine protease
MSLGSLRSARLAVAILSILTLMSVSMLTAAAAAPQATGFAHSNAWVRGLGSGAHRMFRVRDNNAVGPLAAPSPVGLSPATIKSAYNFSTSLTAGSGKTIAIVDAFNDPTAESDLGVFSSQYGLPACTTANGCFKKVNQTGGTSLPPTDAGWALEISLDIQWAHAIAPGAKILLVEATSASFANLLAAEDYAKTHAQYVSNSWGASEFSGESSFDSHFSQAGVSFFVSAGDAGLPAEYPSSSPNVISVGGTTLTFNSSGQLTSETGWSDGGGGCSRFERGNASQLAFSGYSQAGCRSSRRATPDVSLDADPASGVSVFDSTPFQGQSGWFQVGGTSASSPMWAARSAVAGATVNASFVYGSSITYRDITVGNNGAPCRVGFDLCSGRGSWIGQTP